MADELDELAIAILRHCMEGNRLSGLTDRFPHTTVYRRAPKLVSMGYLTKKDRLYRTTDQGRNAVDAPVPVSTLDGIIPQLSFAPTPLHRAILELVVSAVIARRYALGDSHHATLFLVGRTLTAKTWTGRMACLMFGLDPLDHVLLAHAESGRSLLTRRGFQGKTVSKRDVLASSLIVIDEFHKVDANARRMAGVYLQGTRVVAYENERLDIRPVPIFLLNPFKGDTLQERTGLDDAEVRRCIIADLDEVTIPEAWRSRGEEFLAEAKKLKPIALGVRRPVDCSAFHDQVAETLRRGLKPDAVKGVDEDLVMQLVEGMAAFLPPEEAWVTVVRDLFVVWNTLKWTATGWQLAIPPADSVPSKAPSGPPKEEPVTLREETSRVLAEVTRIPRDLGLARRVAAKSAELKSLGKAEEAKRKSLRASQVNAQGEIDRLHREAGTTPQWIAEFLKVNAHLNRVGLTWNAPAFHQAADLFAKEGVNAGKVIGLAHDLVDHGIRDGVADLVVKSMPAGMTWTQVAAWLGDLAGRYGNLQSAIAAREAEERDARDRAAKATHLKERCYDEAKAALEQRNAALAGLAEVDTLIEERALRVQDLEDSYKKNQKGIEDARAEHDRLRAENARIRSAVETGKARLARVEDTLARQHHLSAVHGALRAALLGNGKAATWILNEMGARPGDDPVRELRDLVRKALGDSVVPLEDVNAERAERNAREAELRTRLDEALAASRDLQASLDSEREVVHKARAEGEASAREKDEVGRQLEALTREHRGLTDRLAGAEYALATEKTARKDAEARVGTLEAAAVGQAEERKKVDAELRRYREKAEAAGRVLPLAPDGRPIPLEELDARVARFYGSAIERHAKAEANRLIARAMASRGLVAIRAVTLTKTCARRHTFPLSLTPAEIERVRTGETTHSIVIYRKEGQGYASCPKCRIGVLVTLGEIAEALAAQSGS